ncbi:MAG: hypothetical protein MUO23_03195 [Anaerolineales bacterium]|nr:hypothetical protein [Anaerolineales bacterium]
MIACRRGLGIQPGLAEKNDDVAALPVAVEVKRYPRVAADVVDLGRLRA